MHRFQNFFSQKSDETNKKIIQVIQIFMFFTLVACVILGVITENEEVATYLFVSAFTSVIMILLSYIPSYISEKTPFIFPMSLQVIVVVFILLAEFFGEILRFYDRFWWWDGMLHTSAGVLLGIFGVLVVYSLNTKDNVFYKMHPITIMLFAFCFALACGAVWELFEYSGDILFGMNMQRSVYSFTQPGTPEFEQEAIAYFTEYIRFYPNLGEGKTGRVFDLGLMDTMEDFILDSLGATLSVILVTIAMKKSKRI